MRSSGKTEIITSLQFSQGERLTMAAAQNPWAASQFMSSYFGNEQNVFLHDYYTEALNPIGCHAKIGCLRHNGDDIPWRDACHRASADQTSFGLS